MWMGVTTYRDLINIDGGKIKMAQGKIKLDVDVSIRVNTNRIFWSKKFVFNYIFMNLRNTLCIKTFLLTVSTNEEKMIKRKKKGKS